MVVCIIFISLFLCIQPYVLCDRELFKLNFGMVDDKGTNGGWDGCLKLSETVITTVSVKTQTLYCHGAWHFNTDWILCKGNSCMRRVLLHKAICKRCIETHQFIFHLHFSLIIMLLNFQMSDGVGFNQFSWDLKVRWWLDGV